MPQSSMLPSPLVRDAMTTAVHTLHMDATVKVAARLFEKKRLHHIIVLEKDHIFGVVSDRDILRVISPFLGNPRMERSQDLATLRTRLHQIMTRKLVTIGPDETLAAAAAQLLSNRVSCLPVVDQAGAIQGIVTIRDFVRQLMPSPVTAQGSPIRTQRANE